DFFVDDSMRSAEYFDLAFVIVIGINYYFDIERFALAHLGGHIDGRYLDFGIRACGQRHRGHRHLASQGRTDCITHGLITIGEQNDAWYVRWWHRRRGDF